MTATPTTARIEAISWSCAVLANPRTVFLDTETTGLGEDAEVCDLAIVDRHGRTVLNTLIRPEKPIPPEATAVHGITDEMVADAPRWSDSGWHTTVMSWGESVVVYNVGFDGPIIDRLAEARGFKPMSHGWHCAMRAYSDFNGTVDRRFPVRVSRFGPQRELGRLKWWKLSEAAAHLGITPNGAHRALSDCLTTLAVVKAMAAFAAPPIPTEQARLLADVEATRFIDTNAAFTAGEITANQAQAKMFSDDPETVKRLFAEQLTR